MPRNLLQVPVGQSGAKAFSDSILAAMTDQEERRLIAEEQAREQEQADFQRQQAERAFGLDERALGMRERELQQRIDSSRGPDLSFMDDEGLTDSQKLIRLRAAGVSGDLGDFGAGPKMPKGDFGEYLAAYANEIGKNPNELSASEIEAARGRFGRADDAAPRPVAIRVGDKMRFVVPTAGMEYDAPAGAQDQSSDILQSVVRDIGSLSAAINTKMGPEAKAIGTYRQLAAAANLDDDVAEYLSIVEAYVPIIARRMGHTGVLTEPDVERTIRAFPMPGDSAELRKRKIARLNRLVGVEGAEAIAGGDGGAAGRRGDNPFGGGSGGSRRQDNPFGG